MVAKITAIPDAVGSTVLVTVTGATGPTAEILRIDSSGLQTPVRNGDPGTLLGGGWIDHDYEAPLDSQITYTVGSRSNYDSVQATSSVVTLDSLGETWIKHPGRPDLNMAIKVIDMGDRTYPIAQGIFNPVGRKYPIAVSSLRFAATHTMTVLTETQDELENLRAVLNEPSIVLFQTPGGYDVGSVYVAVGDIVESRIVPVGYETGRTWTLPFTVVEAPIGLASAGAGNSWDDVVSTYATWNAVKAAKATWNDLIRQVAP